MWEAFTAPGRSRWAEKEGFFIFIYLWNGDLKQELEWASTAVDSRKEQFIEGPALNYHHHLQGVLEQGTHQKRTNYLTQTSSFILDAKFI